MTLTLSAANNNDQYSGILTQKYKGSPANRSKSTLKIFHMVARSWLSGPRLHLSTKQATLGWQESTTELSDPPWLAKHLLFCIIKRCFGLIEWRSPTSGSRLTWAGWRSPGRMGRAVGVLRTPTPTWCTPWGKGLAHGWGRAGFAWAGSVQVTAGLSLTFAAGEKCRAETRHTKHMAVAKPALPPKHWVTAGPWCLGVISFPSSPYCAVNQQSKPQLNMVFLEGARISPRLQYRPPSGPGSAFGCLLATLAPSKVMLHVIAQWFTALFGFSGSWSHVYQQNTHSPVSGFKQIGAIQNAFEQDALHSQA